MTSWPVRILRRLGLDSRTPAGLPPRPAQRVGTGPGGTALGLVGPAGRDVQHTPPGLPGPAGREDRPFTGPTLDDGTGPWEPRWAQMPPVPASLPMVADTRPRGASSLPPSRSPSDRPQLRPFAGEGLPWSAVGRVDVPGGWGSGVLVGPRHVLTASHVIAWGRGGSRHQPGWLRFTPSARPGQAPFGVAAAFAVLYTLPVVPPVIEPAEERYDYAICVLDRRVGDEIGWLGVRGYRDEWDGNPLWTLVGYRGPTAADAEPVAVSGLHLDGHNEQSDDSQVIFHSAAVAVGTSGGPVLAQWPGEPVPSVVAVQSWSNEHRSGACGGHRLVELVASALREYP